MKLHALKWVALAPLVLALGVAGCAEDGDDGVAGPPGTAECMNCHSDDFSEAATYLVPFQTEYAHSQHAVAENFVRRSTPCSGCHSNEGFQGWIETGTPPALTTSSTVGCFTCHAPHTEEDFSLRTTAPVALQTGGATYDKGAGNLCANCHQARAASPAIDSPNAITSTRWGPHHSPQANLLIGSGAWVMPGATYGTEAAHNAAIEDGCVTCHMAPTATDGLAGGHTFAVLFELHGAEEINAKGCSCHNFANDAAAHQYVTEAIAAFDAKLDQLGQMLLDLGWVRPDLASINPQGAPAQAGGSPDDRGAIWNFIMMKEAKTCGGIHNPGYGNDVVDATIAYVETRKAQLAQR